MIRMGEELGGLGKCQCGGITYREIPYFGSSRGIALLWIK